MGVVAVAVGGGGVGADGEDAGGDRGGEAWVLGAVAGAAAAAAAAAGAGFAFRVQLPASACDVTSIACN